MSTSMLSQGVFMKSSPPLPAPALPLIDPCNTATTSHELHHQLLAFCSTSPPQAAPPPPPTSAEPRRLAKAPHPTHILKCPRCASSDTKFCYYNNYSLSQPRYFCKNCKRYWTAGGILRNVPVGGGLRKNKRSKLKLAADAEAAAAAARELSAHHEGKPSSPVQANQMGSCSITANSSVVSGLQANAAGHTVAPNMAPSHVPAASHLPRTSSGSECSTIDYVGNENSNQLHHFYHGVPAYGVRPQFYTSCSAPSLASTSCNQQYSSSSGEEGGARSSLGYDGIGVDDVAGSNPDLGNAPMASYSVKMKANSNHANMEGEKAEINTKISSNSNYDWQFMSENLFQGEGGFLHMPGGGWPDFSQFHEPTGPG